MKTMLCIAFMSLFFVACAGNKAKPIDYVSPCACYDIIKYKG